MVEPKPLDGMEIAIFVESDFVYREIHYYYTRFIEEGATVRLITRLWGAEPPTFTDHDFHIPLGLPFESLDQYIGDGIGKLNAIIVPGGFVSDRLRFAEIPGDVPPALELLQQTFLRGDIVKGIICHGLWLVSLCPELVSGRTVTCHNNLIGDVRNMGAYYRDLDVVVDEDLITGRTADQHPAFAAVIIQELTSIAEKI